MQDYDYVYSNTVAYKDNFSLEFGIKRNPADEGYLSIYLYCLNPAPTWSFKAGSVSRVISGKNGVHSSQRYDNDDTFTSSSNNWGFSKFILWSDLINEDNGLITSYGAITVEVLVYPHSFSY